MLFAVTSDLVGDHRTGIPADHDGTFTKLTGQPFAHLASSAPGVTRYITNLEVGYALHELTFAALFLAVVLIPLRDRRLWAWWTCWAVMIANIGYTATFGRHDSTILARSLVADIAVPVFLLLCARRHSPPPRTVGEPGFGAGHRRRQLTDVPVGVGHLKVARTSRSA